MEHECRNCTEFEAQKLDAMAGECKRARKYIHEEHMPVFSALVMADAVCDGFMASPAAIWAEKEAEEAMLADMADLGRFYGVKPGRDYSATL